MSNDVPPLSLAAYGRRRGVTAPAVLKAIRSGRLARSVVRRDDGRLLIADPALADEEWAASRQRARPPASVPAQTSSQPPAAPPAPSPPTPAPAAASSAVGDNLTLTEATAREREFKAKLAEMEYHERRRSLVSSAEVEARMVDTFAKCRTRLLGVPGKVKHAIPALSRQDVAAIDRIIRESLEELAAGGLGALGG